YLHLPDATGNELCVLGTKIQHNNGARLVHGSQILRGSADLRSQKAPEPPETRVDYPETPSPRRPAARAARASEGASRDFKWRSAPRRKGAVGKGLRLVRTKSRRVPDMNSAPSTTRSRQII